MAAVAPPSSYMSAGDEKQTIFQTIIAAIEASEVGNVGTGVPPKPQNLDVKNVSVADLEKLKRSTQELADTVEEISKRTAEEEKRRKAEEEKQKKKREERKENFKTLATYYNVILGFRSFLTFIGEELDETEVGNRTRYTSKLLNDEEMSKLTKHGRALIKVIETSKSKDAALLSCKDVKLDDLALIREFVTRDNLSSLERTTLDVVQHVFNALKNMPQNRQNDNKAETAAIRLAESMKDAAQTEIDTKTFFTEVKFVLTEEVHAAKVSYRQFLSLLLHHIRDKLEDEEMAIGMDSFFFKLGLYNHRTLPDEDVIKTIVSESMLFKNLNPPRIDTVAKHTQKMIDETVDGPAKMTLPPPPPPVASVDDLASRVARLQLGSAVPFGSAIPDDDVPLVRSDYGQSDRLPSYSRSDDKLFMNDDSGGKTQPSSRMASPRASASLEELVPVPSPDANTIRIFKPSQNELKEWREFWKTDVPKTETLDRGHVVKPSLLAKFAIFFEPQDLGVIIRRSFWFFEEPDALSSYPKDFLSEQVRLFRLTGALASGRLVNETRVETAKLLRGALDMFSITLNVKNPENQERDIRILVFGLFNTLLRFQKTDNSKDQTVTMMPWQLQVNLSADYRDVAEGTETLDSKQAVALFTKESKFTVSTQKTSEFGYGGPGGDAVQFRLRNMLQLFTQVDTTPVPIRILGTGGQQVSPKGDATEVIKRLKAGVYDPIRGFYGIEYKLPFFVAHMFEGQDPFFKFEVSAKDLKDFAIRNWSKESRKSFILRAKSIFEFVAVQKLVIGGKSGDYNDNEFRKALFSNGSDRREKVTVKSDPDERLTRELYQTLAYLLDILPVALNSGTSTKEDFERLIKESRQLLSRL